MQQVSLESLQQDVYAYIDRELDPSLCEAYDRLIESNSKAKEYYLEIRAFEDEMKDMKGFTQVEPPVNGWEKFQKRLAEEDNLELDILLPIESSSPFPISLPTLGVLSTGLVAASFVFMMNTNQPEKKPMVPNNNAPVVLAKDSKPAQKVSVREDVIPDFSSHFGKETVGSDSLARFDDGGSSKKSVDEQLTESSKGDRSLPTLSQILINENELNAMVTVPQKSNQKFSIDKFPVTNQEYGKFVSATGRNAPFHWEGGQYKAVDEKGLKPVTYVSWEDARAFCKWEGKDLPTKTQWEKAARGDRRVSYPWGVDFSVQYANTKEAGIGLVEIGMYPRNVSPYGVYEMAGNVSEWVKDDYEGKEVSFFAKKGQYKIMKGGSFLDSADKAQVESDLYGDKDTIFGNTGIRCVKSGI